MHTLVRLGLLLVVLWVVAFVVFKVASFLIHLLLLAAVVMIVWGLVKRGASRTGIR